MKTKVLVTGSSGQLGKTIEELSVDFRDSIEFVFVDKSMLDITNVEQLALFFERNVPNYCINCAAYTNVDLAETEIKKAMDINAEAVGNLAIQCKRFNTTLIHISTDYVFDGNQKTAYKEDDQTNPINVYGKSKLKGEEYIRGHLKDHFIIRTSWLYSRFNKNFVKTVYRKLTEGHELQITTAQQGTPTSCKDLSQFILFLITNGVNEFGTYHLSAKGKTTWYGLGLHIANHLDLGFRISPVDDYKSKAQRPSNSTLDNSKAKSLLNQDLSRWQDSVDITLKNLSN